MLVQQQECETFYKIFIRYHTCVKRVAFQKEKKAAATFCRCAEEKGGWGWGRRRPLLEQLERSVVRGVHHRVIDVERSVFGVHRLYLVDVIAVKRSGLVVSHHKGITLFQDRLVRPLLASISQSRSSREVWWYYRARQALALLCSRVCHEQGREGEGDRSDPRLARHHPTLQKGFFGFVFSRRGIVFRPQKKKFATRRVYQSPRVVVRDAPVLSEARCVRLLKGDMSRHLARGATAFTSSARVRIRSLSCNTFICMILASSTSPY